MADTVRIRDYVLAAISMARYEGDDEGTVSGSIPSFPGILAFGDDRAECERDLDARITDWVGRALAHGYQLPVIDGIDLHAEKGRGSLPHRRETAKAPGGEFYTNEAELEAAFTLADDTLVR